MNLGLWLERTAAVNGAAPALSVGQTLVADYAAFHARAAGLAAETGTQIRFQLAYERAVLSSIERFAKVEEREKRAIDGVGHRIG